MLIDWINDVLVGERIIVKDLAEDLYDGQVLQKLFGKLTIAYMAVLQLHCCGWTKSLKKSRKQVGNKPVEVEV